jgi:large subunit ribosomal protein L14
MIQPQTQLNVADNSGARRIICIRVLGSTYATLGSSVIAVVKESLPNMTTRRSEVVRAVVVRVRQTVRRIDGSHVRYDENAAVIINSEGNPRGSRIFGPIAREVRDKGFSKIISLSSDVVSYYIY